MKQKPVLLKMSVGYAINGMKKILPLVFKINYNLIYFTKTKIKNISLFIFSSIIISQDFSPQINKKINQNSLPLFLIGILYIFIQLMNKFFCQKKKKSIIFQKIFKNSALILNKVQQTMKILYLIFMIITQVNKYLIYINV